MVNLLKGVGRNDPCPCGSGKKFKKCCLSSPPLDRPLSGLHLVDPAAGQVARSALGRAIGAMREYDPLTEPAPEQWLTLDERERIDLVSKYHRRAGIRPARGELHAVIHVVVENQIADAELPVRGTAQRLISEGLDRHQAIHAIGSVLAGHLNHLMREIESDGQRADTTSGRDSHKRYFAELEALTAEGWLRSA